MTHIILSQLLIQLIPRPVALADPIPARISIFPAEFVAGP